MEMKMPTTLSAVALAMTLGLGFCVGTAQAQTAAPAEHSATAGEAVSDGWITTKVKSELATTKGVKSMDVTVRTTNGVVTLTGVLATKTQVRKAIAAAKSVKGVKDVDASGLKAKD
jgi:hyperosmotically inducible protein